MGKEEKTIKMKFVYFSVILLLSSNMIYSESFKIKFDICKYEESPLYENKEIKKPMIKIFNQNKKWFINYLSEFPSVEDLIKISENDESILFMQPVYFNGHRYFIIYKERGSVTHIENSENSFGMAVTSCYGKVIK